MSPQPDQVVDALLAEHGDTGDHGWLDNGIRHSRDGRTKVEVDALVLLRCCRGVAGGLRGFARRNPDLILVTHA